MRTEPSSIPHGFRFRRNSRSSLGPIDAASAALDAVVVADGSCEARALSSGCGLAFFDDLALVFTSRYPSDAFSLFRACVRLAERERTGVLTRRPLGAEHVRLLRRTSRACGVTWKHPCLANRRRGSNPHGSIPATPSGLISWRSMRRDARRRRRAVRFDSFPQSLPVFSWHRGLGPGRSPYKAEAPVQLGAVPSTAKVLVGIG